VSWLSDFLHNLAANSTVPIFTALLLGMLAALGPCTISTNIAAIAYISRRLDDRRFAVLASLLYAGGRMTSQTILGVAIILAGLETASLSNFLQGIGPFVIGGLLIVGGLVMLFADRISLGKGGRLANLSGRVSNWGLPGAYLMGFFFGVAFCPYSAVLFFTALLGSVLTAKSQFYLPTFFALGSGLPVIVVGGLLSAGIAAAAGWANSISKYQKYIQAFLALVFIVTGIYVIVTSII
jgi:cytochrome c-type biogenesis protein